MSALGNADHALTLYLLKKAGADATRVQFATMGVDALYPETVGIDLEAAGRVEHALEIGGLIKAGSKVSGLHDTTIAGG